MTFSAQAHPDGRSDRRIAAVIFAAAALYFALGMTLPLEWTDEGLLVYPAWRVAAGELPYRDFQHAYGPASFVLNGILFALFGADLLVVRVSLVLVKAAVAALHFGVARRIASRRAALLATAVLIAIWGMPIWVFNTPYASHYTVALGLLAVLVVTADPSTARCGAAGLLAGIAATFKQTLGALFGAALVIARFANPVVEPADADGDARRRWADVVVSWAACVAAAVLPVAYAARHLTSWSVLVLAGPWIGTSIVVIARNWRQPPSALELRRRTRDIAAMVLGAVLPLMLVAAVYLAFGALSQLAYDVFGGMLSLLDWYVPLDIPGPGTLALIGVLVVVFALVGPASADSLPTRAAMASAVLLAMVASGLYADRRTVFVALGGLAQWMPVALVWATAPSALRREAPPPRRWIWCVAAAALVQLYPCADFAHCANGLPMILPLLAYAIDWAAPPRSVHADKWSPVRAGLIGAALVILVVPAVMSVVNAWRTRIGSQTVFARATGIHPPDRKNAAAAELVRFLDAPEQRELPMWSVGNEQLLYFLAGRRSALQQWEFAFYLISTGLLRPDGVSRLVSAPVVVQALATARPLIIDQPASPLAQHTRSALPELATFLATRYRPAERFGPYVVLRWRDDGPSTEGASAPAQ